MALVLNGNLWLLVFGIPRFPRQQVIWLELLLQELDFLAAVD